MQVYRSRCSRQPTVPSDDYGARWMLQEMRCMLGMPHLLGWWLRVADGDCLSCRLAANAALTPCGCMLGKCAGYLANFPQIRLGMDTARAPASAQASTHSYCANTKTRDYA
eukprot:scaffold910_cov396-Prasinococcus_capsulatus_cf.AAC.60